MTAKTKKYDVIIIGGGPAGLSAAIYTARARLTTLLLEMGLVGGQAVNAERLDNYPGFPDGISGMELAERMRQQAEKYGLETLTAEVTGAELDGKDKTVFTTEGKVTARTVIIAGGCRRQKLEVPGEAEFGGRGVSYCATCDGAFFRDVPVAVVGGGNSAVTEALHLTKFASRVTVIHRRDKLRASAVVQEKAFAEQKIDFAWDSVVERIEGEDTVKRLKLRNVKTDETSTLDVAGVFVSTGLSPNTDYLKGVVPLDGQTGAVIVNADMETGVAGVFAAGDIRQHSPRQVIIAAGDGAVAGVAATRYLTEYPW